MRLAFVVACLAVLAVSSALSPQEPMEGEGGEAPVQADAGSFESFFAHIMGRKPGQNFALDANSDFAVLSAGGAPAEAAAKPHQLNPDDFGDIKLNHNGNSEDETRSDLDNNIRGAVATVETAYSGLFWHANLDDRPLPAELLPLWMQHSTYKGHTVYPSVSQWTGTLLVTVQRGHDLPDSDWIGDPEFYARVEMLNPMTSQYAMVDQTSVIESRSPEWKRAFAIRNLHGLPRTRLRLSVHEYDTFADDAVGHAILDWSADKLLHTITSDAEACEDVFLFDDEGRTLPAEHAAEDGSTSGGHPRVTVCYQYLLRRPVDTVLGLLTSTFRSGTLPVLSGPDIFYYSPESALFSLLDPLEALIEVRDTTNPSMSLVKRASKWEEDRIQDGFIKVGIMLHSTLSTRKHGYQRKVHVGADGVEVEEVDEDRTWLASFGHSFDEGLSTRAVYLATTELDKFGQPGVLLTETLGGFALVNTRAPVYLSALHAVVRVVLEATSVLSFTCLEELGMTHFERLIDSILSYSVAVGTAPGPRQMVTQLLSGVGKRVVATNKEVLLRMWHATLGSFLRALSSTTIGRAMGVGVATKAAAGAAGAAGASAWARATGFLGRAGAWMGKANPYILGAQLLLMPSKMGNGWEYDCKTFRGDMGEVANSLRHFADVLTAEAEMSLCLMPREDEAAPFTKRVRAVRKGEPLPAGCVRECDAHCRANVVYLDHTEIDEASGHHIFHLDGGDGKASFVSPVSAEAMQRAHSELVDTIDDQLMQLLRVYQPGNGFFDGTSLDEESMMERSAPVPGHTVSSATGAVQGAEVGAEVGAEDADTRTVGLEMAGEGGAEAFSHLGAHI